MWNRLWITLTIVLATARLTRFITQDYLGHWTLVAPARHWANTREDVDEEGRGLPRQMLQDHEVDPSNGWRSKLVKGLDCPFCVGFWLGLAVLMAVAIAGRVPVLRTPIRFALDGLALNYIVGHLSSRVDG